MERVCFRLQLRLDRLDEYVERHAHVWPDFRVQLLKREPAVPAALVIGGDAQPPEEAVPQIALVIRIERGHDETDELVAVVYETRPGLLRREHVCLSQGP